MNLRAITINTFLATGKELSDSLTSKSGLLDEETLEKLLDIILMTKMTQLVAYMFKKLAVDRRGH